MMLDSEHMDDESLNRLRDRLAVKRGPTRKKKLDWLRATISKTP
jgi:hypothetical protein